MIHVAALLASGSTTVTTTVATATKHSSGSILDPIAKPIAWLLAEIYAVIPNYGVAIIILSIIWMALISPLNLKSTRSMLAMQKLQPELKKLQDKHKNDRQAFAQAQMELFREHGVSPFGACLPMLLPLPIFFALFRVIEGLSHTVNGVSMPKYIPQSSKMYKDIVAAGGHLNAFGMNLSQTALSHHSSFAAALPYWILLLVMGATSYFQSAMIMSRNQANAQANPQMQMQMRMMRFLPLIFVVFCIRFPAGVILYYAMSNVCRIVQQDAMYRFDPKVKALVAKEVQEVEDLTEKFDEDAAPTGPSPSSGGKGAKPGGPKAATGSGGASSKSVPSPAGDGQANGAGGEAPAKPDAKTGGRAWFRGLLENAEQEQKARTAAKAAGAAGAAGAAAKRSTKPAPSSSKGRPAAGNGSGSSRAGGTSTSGNGSASSSKNRSQSNKNRTNRKRRGR
jgi:YidC/Oxa1 family membrane protein insertase